MTLRPYGANLLNNSSSMWFIVISLMMLIMAAVEGLAWGYFTGGFSQNYNLLVSGVGGVLVGLIIWGLDYTIMTHDTKSREYKQQIYGKYGKDNDYKTESKHTHFIASFKYMARIGLAVLSMVLTAPSLSQLVFNADIEQKIRQAQEKAISDIVQKVTNRHQAMVSTLQQQDIDLGQQLILEVAGRVGSKIKGEGATARNIKQQQANIQTKLKNARLAMIQEVDELNDTINHNDKEKLAKKWGVKLNADTTHERQARLIEIQQTQEYKDVKNRVYGGLLFLLLALIAMKLMQGKGLELYFSEFMQEQWQRYKNGAFDAWLEPADCSTALHVIPPSRFEYLMLNGYSREMSTVEEQHKRLETMRKRQEEEEEAAHKQKLENSEYQRQQQREQDAEKRRAAQLEQQHKELEENREKRKLSGTNALVDLANLRESLQHLLDKQQDAQIGLENTEHKIDHLKREIAAAPEKIITVEQQLSTQVAEEEMAKTLLSQVRSGQQRSDIERMKLLTDLHASYTNIIEEKEQTHAHLNDLRAAQELYDGKLQTLQRKKNNLSTRIKALQSQLDDIQLSQQKIINRMKLDAELLGLAESHLPQNENFAEDGVVTTSV